MSFIDVILDKIAPYDCLGCGQEGPLLCVDCSSCLPRLPERCYCCHQPSKASLTCPGCRPDTLLFRAQAATVYTGAAKNLVWRLKSKGTKVAAGVMARQMLLLAPKSALIVPAPTSPDRVRQRGYDQAALLARQLSKHTGLPWSSCLARTSKVHQIGASREQRVTQLKGGFRISKPYLIKNAHILLVDDIITTGATLEAAAEALMAAGAARVEALAYAQPLLHKNTRISG